MYADRDTEEEHYGLSPEHKDHDLSLFHVPGHFKIIILIYLTEASNSIPKLHIQ